jgi:tRNA pseudouridine-54 N-methylase
LTLRDELRASNPLFIVVSATARTSPDIPLRGYAGPSGRLDVVARAFEAIAEEGGLGVGVLLGPPSPPVTVTAGKRCIEEVGGERGFVRAYREALLGGATCLRAYRGVGLRDVLSIASRSHTVIILSEEGLDVGDPGALEAVRGRAAFVLGSHVDMPPEEERVASAYARLRVSVGPLSYHTEHVIAFIEAVRLAGAR